MPETLEDRFELGMSLIEELLGEEFAAGARAHRDSGGFGAELAEHGARNVFAEYWGRPGLDRRSRSLLTIGILIGTGHMPELKYHIAIAIKNGITVSEVEEIVLHALPYAGYPKASHAATAAREELTKLGLLPA
ncbi:carboxymuconolactone decarboxylase family protein [Rhizorhabdus argentea]|uniref:carboxymuconolactone decarboxylase family protein n=1 Tax=Rhizorhabdus argentea TaxID=1387174 RepID=UPI0030EDFD9C